jgi:hypothetical protein
MGQVLKDLTNIVGAIEQQSAQKYVSLKEMPKDLDESQLKDQHLPLKKRQPFVSKTRRNKRKATIFRAD